MKPTTAFAGAGLVEEHINTAYDTVVTVAENLDVIKKVSDDLPAINNVNDSINNVNTYLVMFDAVLAAADEVGATSIAVAEDRAAVATSVDTNTVNTAAAVTAAAEAQASVDNIQLTAIARLLNVLDSEVIYSTDVTKVLNPATGALVHYIFDADNQVTYAVPPLSTTGETLISVDGTTLTTSQCSYTMISINKSGIEFENLAAVDLGMSIGGAVNLLVGDSVVVLDYASGNGSGMLFFRVVAANTSTADGGKYIDLPTQELQLRQNLHSMGNFKAWGGVSGGLVDNHTQLKAQITYLVSQGGGEIYIPAGVYGFEQEDTGTGGGRCIDVQSNITIRGAGVGLTTLKLIGTAVGTTNLMAVRPLDIDADDNGVTHRENICISDISLSNSVDSSTGIDDHLSVLIMAGVSNFRLQNFHIFDSGWYGIGMENGGYRDCFIQNGTISNTVYDGIDMKDNGNNSRRVFFNNLRFLVCGTILETDAAPTCIDVGGRNVTLTNIFCEGDQEQQPKLGCSIRFRWTEIEDDGRGYGGERATLNNFNISLANGYANTDPTVTTYHHGIQVSATDVKITNGYITGGEGDGINVEARNVGISNVGIYNHGRGIQLTSNARGTDARFSNINGVNIASCRTGIDVSDSVQVIINSVNIQDTQYIGIRLNEGIGKSILSNIILNPTLGSGFIDNSLETNNLITNMLNV